MKIVKNRTFSQKVVVTIPNDDGGTDQQSFTGRFKVLSTDEIAAHHLGTDEGQTAYCREIFIGWDDLTEDREGEDRPFEFSVGNHALLMSDVFVRRAVIDTYTAALTGAKRGN